MAGLGTLSVHLEANIAKFTSAMEQAAGVATRQMKVVESAAGIAKVALGGVFAAFSISALKHMVDGTTALAASFDDLAESTGNSVEVLSAHIRLSRETGTAANLVTDSMTRLAKGMAGADDESQGAGHALAFLGVAARDSSGNLRSTSDVMVDVAKRLADFENGAGKAALAQDLFGKSGASLLPYLGELAKAGTLNADVTAQQAAMAEEYQKTTARLGEQKQQLAKVITMAILPSMLALGGAMLSANAEAGGLADKVNTLAGSGSLQSWGREGAMAIAFVVDSARGAIAAFEVVAETIRVVIAQTVSYSHVAMGAMKVFAGKWAEGTEDIKRGLAQVPQFGRMYLSELDAILSRTQFRDKLKAQFAADDVKKGFDDLASAFGIGMEKLPYVTATAAQKAAAEALAAGKKLTDEQKKQWDMLSREWVKYIDNAIEEDKRLGEILGKNADERTKEEAKRLKIGNEMWVAKIDADIEAYEEGLRVMAGLTPSHIQQEQKVWKGFLDGIDSGFREVWTASLGENSRGFKGFVDGLWNTFKRGFMDLVYQSLAKPVFLNLIAGVAGTMGMSGLANAATGAGSNTLMNTALSGAASWAGNMTGFSGFTEGLAMGWGSGVAAPGAGMGETFGAWLSNSGAVLSYFAIALAGAAIAAHQFAAGWRIDGHEQDTPFDQDASGLPGTLWMASAMDRTYRALGFNDEWSAILSGSSMAARIFGRRQRQNDAFGVSGTVGATGVSGQNWQDWSEQGGWFASDRRGQYTAPFSADQQAFFGGLFRGVSDITGGLGRTLGIDPNTALSGYARDFNLQLSQNGETDQAEISRLFNELFAQVLQEQTVMLLRAGGEGKLADLVRAFKGESIAQAVVSLNGFLELMDRDPIGDALEQLEAGQNAIMRAATKNGDALDAVSDAFDGSAESVITLTNATQQYWAAQVALIAKIHEISQAVKDMFAGTREKITLAGMDPQGQYNYFQAQAQLFYERMMASTDPEAVRRNAERMNDFINRAFDLLSAEDQARLSPEFLERLNRADADAQRLLTEAQERIARETRDQTDRIYAILEKAGTDAQVAATTQNTAANTFSGAVNRIVDNGIPLRLSSNGLELAV